MTLSRLTYLKHYLCRACCCQFVKTGFYYDHHRFSLLGINGITSLFTYSNDLFCKKDYWNWNNPFGHCFYFKEQTFPEFETSYRSLNDKENSIVWGLCKSNLAQKLTQVLNSPL